MIPTPSTTGLWMTQLACEHAARLTIHRMTRGMRSLALIARIAPWLGVIVLLDSADNALWVDMTERFIPYADFAGWTQTWLPLAASFLLAAMVLCGRAILEHLSERLRLDMEDSTIQLLRSLLPITR